MTSFQLDAFVLNRNSSSVEDSHEIQHDSASIEKSVNQTSTEDDSVSDENSVEDVLIVKRNVVPVPEARLHSRESFERDHSVEVKDLVESVEQVTDHSIEIFDVSVEVKDDHHDDHHDDFSKEDDLFKRNTNNVVQTTVDNNSQTRHHSDEVRDNSRENNNVHDDLSLTDPVSTGHVQEPTTMTGRSSDPVVAATSTSNSQVVDLVRHDDDYSIEDQLSVDPQTGQLVATSLEDLNDYENFSLEKDDIADLRTIQDEIPEDWLLVKQYLDHFYFWGLGDDVNKEYFWHPIKNTAPSTSPAGTINTNEALPFASFVILS